VSVRNELVVRCDAPNCSRVVLTNAVDDHEALAVALRMGWDIRRDADKCPVHGDFGIRGL
jgi:hypothetical protein